MGFGRPFAGACTLLALTAAAPIAAAAQAETAQYFPLSVGDERVLAGDSGTIFDRVTGQAQIGGTQAWVEVGDHYLTRGVHRLFWTQDATGTRLIAAEVEARSDEPGSGGAPTAAGELLLVSLDPAPTLPSSLRAGQTIEFTGHASAPGKEPVDYSGQVEVNSTAASVDTPAGHFGDCLTIQVWFHATGLDFGINWYSQETRAPGVGLVAVEWDPGSGTGEHRDAYLCHASVGGREWGPPAKETGGYFPLRAGDEWLMLVQAPDGATWLAEGGTGVAVAVGGSTSYPRTGLSPGGPTSAISYWRVEGGKLLWCGFGQPGTAEPGPPGEPWALAGTPVPLPPAGTEDAGVNVLDPPVEVLLPRMYQGQLIVSSADDGVGSIPPTRYQALVRAEALSAGVSTPAGDFDDCLVVSISFTQDPPSPYAPALTRLWLAPGVGPVQAEQTVSSMLPATSAAVAPANGLVNVYKLVWGRLNGREYGRKPVTIATAPYFPLSEGDRRVYRRADSVVEDQRVEDYGTEDDWVVDPFSPSEGGQTLSAEAAQVNTTAAFDAWPFVTYRAGVEERTDWWVRTDEATSWVGFVESALKRVLSGYPRVLEPDLSALPPTVMEGGTTEEDGRLQRYTVRGNLWWPELPWGGYSLRAQARVVGVPMTVPAGVFKNCLVLDLAGTLRPAGKRPEQDVDETWVLARDVGVIQVEDRITPARSRGLVYARVGGRTYGTEPRPGRPGDLNADGFVDTTDARTLLDALLAGAPGYRADCDLHPYSGVPPHVIPAPDGLLDAGDVAAFLAIWRSL